ncbi:MAG: isoprenyl transferase [Caldicoprobacterales bacterium]|jgi:undecaprenyl diphosphate synthase
MNWKNIFKYKKSRNAESLLETVLARPVPRHISIIMDGNGRWAEKRNLPRVAGHKQGVEVLRDIISTSSQIGIAHLTLYAFSTENWKRPESEVRALMSLLVEFLQKEINELHNNKVKIHMLGDINGLPQEAAREVEKAMNLTAANKGLQVNIALNYGSRMEIIKAARKIAREVSQGKLSLDDITEALFSEFLETRGIPDPDLMIRTSGEYRLSNFLLYQSAYTELIFTDKQVFWPDFNRERYLEAIYEYQNRKRRFGGIDDVQAGVE